MENKSNTMVVTLDETLYNDLNRASREYDAAVTDCYYYIINGGIIDDSVFTRLLEEAVEAHYVYSKLKDVVSNDVVIPAVAKAYNVDVDTCYIYDTWNIPFDGSHKCTISGITIKENVTDTVVYRSECPDEYIENVAKLKVRINIINEIISKLNSVTLPEFAEKTAKSLKDKRLQFMQDDSINTNAFVRDFVTPKIVDIEKDPETLIWTINVVEKSFTITEKAFGSNITCTSCSSCN